MEQRRGHAESAFRDACHTSSGDGGRDSEGGRKYRGNGGSEEEEQGDVC